ncbi:MAG: PilN domain-containing protein [Candidatus Latescibacteria bacterium]|nr:PilN domain-containing protein [Candidatus Latescibacterota bacterium]
MYIDINLLPREFRPKRAKIPLDYRSLAVLLIILTAIGMGTYYFYLGNSLKSMDRENQSLLQQLKLLQKTVDLQEEVDGLTKKVSERVSIIRGLTEDSDLRFAMIQHINSILPENLWLLSISEINVNNTVSFNIEGMSYTKESISVFLQGLEKYKRFSNVTLQSITPSPIEIQDAFQYIVKVDLATYQPPEPEVEKGAKDKKPKKK